MNRYFSPTTVKQWLGSMNWRGEKSALDLTFAANVVSVRE
jgi:hypothetical protein